MSSQQPPGTPGPPRSAASGTAAGLLESLRRGSVVRLQPLLREAQDALHEELTRRRAVDRDDRSGDDDLANLSILSMTATLYERRWQDCIAEGFSGWPTPAVALRRDDAYALVSDDELASQLVGQPVTEALDRRFIDILDVINSRLWSFAASLGTSVRPLNPVSPRRLITSFLDTFPSGEASATLRSALLRHYERLAGEQFASFYNWFNAQLADAGHTMSTGSDVAMLMASPLGNMAAPTDAARNSVWSQANALSPTGSSWRGDTRAGAGDDTPRTYGALRGELLKAAARARRTSTGHDSAQRELRLEEVRAVLSLVQGDATAVADHVAAGVGQSLLDALDRSAAGLGITNDRCALAAAQRDTFDVIGLLFDGLAADHALSEDTLRLLAKLSVPYLVLALHDAEVFDSPDHPAMALLSLLLESWDANPVDNDADRDLHAVASSAAMEVIDDYHGELAVMQRTLSRLREALEPGRRRAEIAERRAWQSIQGRERLYEARSESDRQLARVGGRPLLAGVAQFLDDQWRQSLIQSWLRDGADSSAYAALVAVGDAIVAIDVDAAGARGHAVANGLIRLQPALRDCHVACGLDESAANQLVARLVGELSNPDAIRQLPTFTPLVDRLVGDGRDVTPVTALQAGQAVAHHVAGAEPVRLRLAWRSPLTGTCVLVNRKGSSPLVIDAARMEAMLADGRLRARAVAGPVEGVLQSLAGGSMA